MVEKKRVYLDHCATTPLSWVAREALISTLDIFGNPSSIHAEGRAAKKTIQKARYSIAECIHADPENVIFTSGATEAAMTLITPHYRSKDDCPLFMSHFYYSATEHPCIRAGGSFGSEMITKIPVNHNGVVMPKILQAILAGHDNSKGLPLVAIQYANQETGVIQPIKILADIVKRAGGIFIVDSVQWLTSSEMNISDNLGDFFILCAHKFGGPKGIGAIVASSDIVMPRPLILGGGQERRLRAGTEAVPLIAAFGAVMRDIKKCSLYYTYYKSLKNLQKYLEKELKNNAPNSIVHGKAVARLPNITFFSIPEIKAETLQIAFDLEGVSVSTGAACTSGNTAESSVLEAMGIREFEGGIRVSTGINTQVEDIDYFLLALKKILERKK